MSNRTVTFLACVILFLFCATSSHADVEAGRAAANRGDFRRAYDEWRPLAEAGNAEAQYNLGRLYANGDGVLRSYSQAYRWFEASALNGNKKAQLAIARMYRYGDGVTKDLRKSEKWKSGEALREVAQQKPTEKTIASAQRPAAPEAEPIVPNKAVAQASPVARTTPLALFDTKGTEKPLFPEAVAPAAAAETPLPASFAPASQAQQTPTTDVLDELLQSDPGARPITP